MNSDDHGPTLTDSIGMGGVNSQDGVAYQLWDCMSRVPGWLANPSFEAMIVEGLEDFEARFFAPHAPQSRLVERYQAKSGHLAPREVREVFEQFMEFEGKHPQLARIQTLVTPQLPPTLAWVGRDVERVRKARPFYAPFPGIMAASNLKLTQDFVQEFGDDLGRFLADNVEVAERVIPDRKAAVMAFGLALTDAFADIEVGPRKIESAFDALATLLRGSIGEKLDRARLTKPIEGALGTKLRREGVAPLHVRSDRNSSNELAIELDASMFSGGANGFPPPAVWTSALVEPLERTSQWLTAQGIARVVLTGSYRLTTGFVLGWSLRAACGFELEVPTKGRPWCTDERPGSMASMPAWRVDEPRLLAGDRLLVAVGVIRNPAEDLRAAGADPASILTALLNSPISAGEEAQAGAAQVKAAVATAASRLRPKIVDLFVAAPAAFAVVLGHRWNALGPTQLHEWLPAERRYLPTAVLP